MMMNGHYCFQLYIKHISILQCKQWLAAHDECFTKVARPDPLPLTDTIFRRQPFCLSLIKHPLPLAPPTKKIMTYCPELVSILISAEMAVFK